MPTHRVLKSVAHDVAQSLVSRNDDLSGYWALGQLLGHVLANRTASIVIDFKCAESTPSLHESPLSRLPSQWTEVFWRNVNHKKMQRANVANASATVTFDFASGREGARGSVEYPVTLQVSIEDDRGRAYSGSADLWCSPHDPKRELKSVRGA